MYQSYRCIRKMFNQPHSSIITQCRHIHYRISLLSHKSLLRFSTSTIGNREVTITYTDAEVRSARGRADAVVKTPKYIYVFEFKLHDTAEAALKQIDDKGYLIPYQADGREVIKIGVEFSAEKRNISRWLV